MARSGFDTGGFDAHVSARSVAAGEEEGLPSGFWFGRGDDACWRSVYASYSEERLCHEESELWAERARLAEAGRPEAGMLEPIMRRIALVEDRLREIRGAYS